MVDAVSPVIEIGPLPVPLKTTCSPDFAHARDAVGFVPLAGAVNELLVFIFTTLPAPFPLVQLTSKVTEPTEGKIMAEACVEGAVHGTEKETLSKPMEVFVEPEA